MIRTKSMIRVLYAALIVIGPLVGCGRQANPEPRPSTAVDTDEPNGDKLFGADIQSPMIADTTDTGAEDATTSLQPRLRFTDVAEQLGLHFVYQTGETGRSLMVETMGGGVGALDYDLDGNCDLFFCQGGDPTAGASDSQPPVALFRNAPLANWTDVAQAANLSQYGYGQGVAIGDYNADGFEDVYLTSVGRNTLLENMGDGTFRDVTDRTNTGGSRWSSSAAMADLSGDGLLDLYVCNYVMYDPNNPRICRNSKGEYRICHPAEVRPWPDDCFINLGNGQFREESQQRGLFGDGGKGLGVAVADFDVDHDPDVYVANDTTANFLFLNDGQGRYQERALLRGCAVNNEGLFQASMGLAVGDYDRNGFLDIYSTHYYEESNTLYRNLGPVGFQDMTGRLGLHSPTLQSLGFGTVMHDFDQNGWHDLFVTNGHVENYAGNPLREMRPQLFRYDGSRWHERGVSAGPFFHEEYVGRGVATIDIDIDNDGDLDLAVVHQDEPAALLRNDSQRGNWLKLTFVGHRSPRQGIGCRVTVAAGEIQYVQELIGGGSYASTHQSTLVFGLGSHPEPCRIEVRWPSGEVQVLEEIDVNQSLVVEEPNMLGT